VRSLASLARPITWPRYRPPGALARGHARPQVAARGEELARSRALQVGQDERRARARARASLNPGRVFVEARS
jgi:hypothetical protein